MKKLSFIVMLLLIALVFGQAMAGDYPDKPITLIIPLGAGGSHDLNARIFSGNYPTGIVWADRYKEEHGDYKKLAYLNYRTLELEIEKSCPKELIPIIQADAKLVQDKKGEQYQVSGSGQTVTLGGK